MHGEQRANLERREIWMPSFLTSPFGLMNRFAEEMERAFENFGMGRALVPGFGRELGARGWGEMGSGIWSPQLEVFEREGQFVIRADLPGLSKDDVKVDITDEALTIQGERRQEHEEQREGYYRSERGYGRFFRRIALPEGVNADAAKASFRDGVLEITLPAPQRQERRRQIEIK
jgi:HSP20 family protein